MANYITIDGGTTNTRVNLIKNGIITDTVNLAVGVKANIGGTQIYKDEIKCAIKKILADNNCNESDIEKILCSGMITSDLGLCQLTHLTLPCGIKEMAAAIEHRQLPEISDIPFVFIRGLKTGGTTFETADMMRGEETELTGLCGELEADCLYVLPGSHSKLIHTDKCGRISDFSTQLTGEMIETISSHTILSGSIDLKNSVLDTEYLKKGFNYTQKHGINAALFKVRTLKVLFNSADSAVYSFFMGAVLHSEIESIVKSPAKKVIIGGKSVLKNPIAHLLEYRCDKEIICISDEISDVASARGAVRIYEFTK